MRTKIITAVLLVGLIAVALTQDNCTPILGTASAFNLFLFGSLNGASTDIEGRAAVAGDASLANVGIGFKLTAADDGKAGFVVGGNLAWTSGQLYHGNLVYGISAALTSVNILNGVSIQNPNAIDFAAEKTFLVNLAASLAGTAANANAVYDGFGKLTITVGPGNNFVNIAATQFATVNTLVINSCCNGILYINIQGTSFTFQNAGVQLNGISPSQILWVMKDVTNIALSGIQLEGSVLAPNADAMLANGNIQGTFIANHVTISRDQPMEFHNYPFVFCVPPPPPPPPPPGCVGCEDVLGVAAGFNVFVFTELRELNSDIGGKVAVGTDAFLQSTGIATALDASFANQATFIVGHDVTWNNGELHQGFLVYGGQAFLSNNGFPNGPPQPGSLINFAAAKAFLTLSSSAIAGLATTGSADKQFSTLTFDASVNGINIFKVDAALFSGVNNIQIIGHAGVTTAVIITVTGSSFSFGGAGMNLQGGLSPKNVLWNFVDATSINLFSIGWQGSILAPNADVVFNWGAWDGTLVANSLRSTAEGHLQALCIPCIPDPEDIPE